MTKSLRPTGFNGNWLKTKQNKLIKVLMNQKEDRQMSNDRLARGVVHRRSIKTMCYGSQAEHCVNTVYTQLRADDGGNQTASRIG
jgi:16S rRNA C1402 N4-methylase RsmH